jgi:hypothetical protein
MQSRRNELWARDAVARAERHGWKYDGLHSDGYFVRRGDIRLFVCRGLMMVFRVNYP